MEAKKKKSLIWLSTTEQCLDEGHSESRIIRPTAELTSAAF